MQKTIITCPKCKNNNFLCNIGGENTTISCKKCGNVFDIQNLIGNINAGPSKALPNGWWFFKYTNDDVRIGVSLQNHDVISTFKVLFMPFFACFLLLFFILPLPDVFFGNPAMTSITLAWLIPAALYAICITGVLLFGRFEFCINSKESHSFVGFFKFGFKKRFFWDEVIKIYCENGIICLRCWRGKKFIKINFRGMPINEEEILFLESALNCLFRMKYNQHTEKILPPRGSGS